MADLGTNIKGIWMKSMEAIGNAASSIATNTRSKVDEMNLVNRKNEILKDFSSEAYVLWQKGEHFPGELESMLQELAKLDEQLNDLRAERLAGVKTETADPTPPDEAAEAAAESAETVELDETTEELAVEAAAAAVQEEADDPVPVIRVENPETEKKPAQDLSSAINDLFDQVPSAEAAAEKVNSVLDSLEDGLKQFSDSMDEKIDQLSEKISE